MNGTVRIAPLFLLAVFAAGCGAQLTRGERIFLENIAYGIGPLKERYAELEGFPARTVRIHRNYFSHTYNKEPAAGVPLANPNYYWFKVSLSTEAVDAFDSPGPLLTLRIPRYQKYLKIRVRGANKELTRELTALVLEEGLKAGGEDPRWGTGEEEGGLGRTGRGRRGRALF